MNKWTRICKKFKHQYLKRDRAKIILKGWGVSGVCRTWPFFAFLLFWHMMIRRSFWVCRGEVPTDPKPMISDAIWCLKMFHERMDLATPQVSASNEYLLRPCVFRGRGTLNIYRHVSVYVLNFVDVNWGINTWTFYNHSSVGAIRRSVMQ